MTENLTYTEKVSSNKTTALFVALTLLFLALCIWRAATSGFDPWAIVLLLLFAFFAFYSLNYRALIIQLSAEFLTLAIGVFRWKIPVENIEQCAPDDISLWRIGGAGIHFTFIRGRYRAMFNFLEHPRVVVALEKKKGPVKEIAFSTRQPEKVLSLIQETALAKRPRTLTGGDWTLNIYFHNRGSEAKGNTASCYTSMSRLRHRKSAR